MPVGLLFCTVFCTVVVFAGRTARSQPAASPPAPATANLPAAPDHSPAAPDAVSTAGSHHRELAKIAAGTRWSDAYRYSCTAVGHNFNDVADEWVEPQSLFDGVSIVGDRGTAIVVIKTSAGTLLIDSGYSTKTESRLLPALASLGIDPADVKYILLTHGHSDHFGGAAYFQSHYGTRIVASAEDWELMKHPAPPPGAAIEAWMLAPPPHPDMIVADGGEIVLGKLHVLSFLIPGHTPGALGYVFPVNVAGRTHTAAIFGGTILGMGRISNDGLRQYIASLQHFAQVTRRHHVDVELQNHPLFDDTWVKAAALAARKPGAANPFVVGESGYQNFLTVISECTQATLADRGQPT
jgi:metallo-beta-lactamase class B